MVRAVVDVISDYAPDMRKMLDYYELVDALNGGIDAMRLDGPKWLEPFPQELPDDYTFRLSQTKMTNVFSDICESLASKPFEEPVTLTGSPPDYLNEFIRDVDGAGQNITIFSSDVFEAGIRSSIDWIFVDSPKSVDGVRTLADKRAAGIRPYWTRIIAVNVLEARPVMVGGDERLGYFRYKEPQAGDKDRVRELELSADRRSVNWRLYEFGDSYNEITQTHYTLIESGVMEIDEIPIVPFITGRRVGRSFELKPPMKAAADAQRDLYHQESALKYAKVLAAYPMLSGNGVKPDYDEGGKIKPIGIGPQRVLYAPPYADGSVGNWSYVEPNANTLMFLAKDINDSIQNLRELGRQPLTAQSENLTSVTTAFAAGKTRSSVSAWADRLKVTLNAALRITLKWEGIVADGSFDVFVFTDFDNFTDNDDVEQLNEAVIAGKISMQTYLEELKRRGFLPRNFDTAQEMVRLLTESTVDDDENITEG